MSYFSPRRSFAMRHHSGVGVGPLLEQMSRRKERARAAELLRLVVRRGAAGFVVLLAVASLWSYARSWGAHDEADRVHCLLLMDRSASMRSATEAVVQGFNDFVSQQREAVEGEMLLTLALFDSVRPLEYTIAAQDIRTVQPLRPDQFQPRGTAPLFDALAKVVGHAERLEHGRQTEVVVVVVSDGAENASKEFTQAQVCRHRPTPRSTPMLARARMTSHAFARHCAQQVFRLVEAKRRAGWSFVFLGANQDAYGTGSRLAFSKGAVSNFRPDASGVRAAYSDLNQVPSRPSTIPPSRPPAPPPPPLTSQPSPTPSLPPRPHPPARPQPRRVPAGRRPVYSRSAPARPVPRDRCTWCGRPWCACDAQSGKQNPRRPPRVLCQRCAPSARDVVIARVRGPRSCLRNDPSGVAARRCATTSCEGSEAQSVTCGCAASKEHRFEYTNTVQDLICVKAL